MKTLTEVLTASTEYLKKSGVENPRREAEELIAAVLGLKRIELYMQFDRPLVEYELERCREYIKRRSKREPSAYITGNVFLSNVHIKTTRDVLIPRLETEILVEKIAAEFVKNPPSRKVLWDMCTGSGFIAIALKKRFPDLVVIATDISKEALIVAQENALLNQVEITFLEGDLFAPLEGTCHYFVCNPPYISKNDYKFLSPEVRLFEPLAALDGGESGLEFYERIAEELPRFLMAEGRAWLEIGYDQGGKLKNLFEKGDWKGCLVENDWAGHPRFLSIVKY